MDEERAVQQAGDDRRQRASGTNNKQNKQTNKNKRNQSQSLFGARTSAEAHRTQEHDRVSVQFLRNVSKLIKLFE